MRRLLNICFVLFCLCLLPVCAFAQDNMDNTENTINDPEAVSLRTAESNFGGLRFGGYLLVGAGRCDDKLCPGQPEVEWNQENTSMAFSFQMEFGYLWHERIYIGPVITMHTGWPEILGIDLRLKMAMPINDHYALTFSAGWGLDFLRVRMESSFVGDYDDNAGILMLLNGMYIPMEFGYEHVFDKGFVFGVAIEARISFDKKGDNGDCCNKDQLHPVLGLAGIGIHLGYAF